MEFIDLIESLIVGKAEEEGKDVNEVVDEVIWNLQVREQEGEYDGYNECK